MQSLTQIAEYLNNYLRVGDFPHDLNGIYRSSERLVSRIGLALEPFPDLEHWVDTYSLDAVCLHRPWKLEMTPALNRACIGFLAYHLPFDERLTTGYNPFLASALGMSNLQAFGEKDGRPIGMVGDLFPVGFNQLRSQLVQEFNGEETTLAGIKNPIKRLAVAGAMTSDLVNQAAQLQADAYLTGQWRKDAYPAILSHGLALFATGHHRCEMWGLKALGQVLQQQWGSLKVFVYDKEFPEKNAQIGAFSS
jgi:putative NIF3 family GTP cyclohydrolase 1 type 2